jgi:hypothetical protein
MKDRMLRNVTIFFIIGLLSVFMLSCGGSSGGGDDDGDGNGGTQSYSANGTFAYDSNSGVLTVIFETSEFPDCGPKEGVEIIIVDSITETTMVWDDGDMTWKRDSGTSGNIVGKWNNVDSAGNSYELIFNADGTLSLEGDIVDCGTDTPDSPT